MIDLTVLYCDPTWAAYVNLVRRVGYDFHPDTPAVEYVDERVVVHALLAADRPDALASDLYEVALAVFEEFEELLYA